MFLSSVFGSSFSVRVPASPRILGESAGATLQVINIMSPPEIGAFPKCARISFEVIPPISKRVFQYVTCVIKSV